VNASNIFLVASLVTNCATQCGPNKELKVIPRYHFIDVLADLPTASNGVIYLEDAHTYMFTNHVDLLGSRIICGVDTMICGTSSENAHILSTGLSNGSLISSAYTWPCQNITIESGSNGASAIHLDATSSPSGQALDFLLTNFENCADVGLIKGYNNCIMSQCSFINCAGLVIDSSIATFGINTSILIGRGSGALITLPSSLTVTRRCRVIFSSVVVCGTGIGIHVDPDASIPTEAYLMNDVNFSGGAPFTGGAYLSGITDTSNKTLFRNCVGVKNTSVNGQLYMITPIETTFSDTTTFVKVLGGTSPSVDNSKFSHEDNRLTCEALIQRKNFLICSVVYTSANNKGIEFGFFDSSINMVRLPSRTKSTASGSARSESVTFQCFVQMKQGDYIEIVVRNTTNTGSVLVTGLNFSLNEF
jgi:hypothetical protein